jgi:hypothetical protein
MLRFFIVGQVGQEVHFGGNVCLDAIAETSLLTPPLFYALFLFFLGQFFSSLHTARW